MIFSYFNYLLYINSSFTLNCKQVITANKDWVDPDLNKDYAAWADHNHTVILPAKVRKPKWKSSVENAVGILECCPAN